jgi:hypothetical protein
VAGDWLFGTFSATGWLPRHNASVAKSVRFIDLPTARDRMSLRGPASDAPLDVPDFQATRLRDRQLTIVARDEQRAR